MLAFPGMIAEAARQAGIKVPPDADNFDYNEFPHFQVFCNVQLGRPMNNMGEHWDNAHVIASIPENLIRTTTLSDLIDNGLSWSV